MKVYGIGNIEFKTGRAGFGERIYRYEYKQPAKYYCPVHKKYELKGHIYYYCDKCNKYYRRDQVIRVPPLQKTKPIKTLTVQYIVKKDNIPDILLDLNNGVYLIPIDKFENIINLNEFIKLLLETDGLAVTTKARARTGGTSKNYGIFVDEDQNALIMAPLLSKTGLVKVPDYARYKEKYVKSAQQIKQAKMKLLKR